MASNSTTVFSTAPLAGVDLDSKSSTPAHRLLTKVAGSEGRTHVYCKASEALGSASNVKIGAAGSASSDAGTAGYNCNTTGGVALGQYFWAQRNSLQ